jgi:hypothetical protein
MRIPGIKILLILLLAIMVTGCRERYILSDKQVILFQMEYINYAWGYQHHGYFIDNEGNVLTYNNPEEWNFPGENFILTQDKLFANLSKCTKYERIIPRLELEKTSKHIANIAASKVTAEKNVGADMGSLTYNCFQFDESSLTYKGYLIKKEGDYTCENLNLFSKKVASWIKEAGDNLSKK